MGVKGLAHYVCQSTVASREISLEDFAKEYQKQHNRQPLLVFDGESFWHTLHGTLPRIFGGQFIQFRKKAEDFCKRLIQLGYRLTFVFGNSPISVEAKAEERGKQTLLHLTSFYRQLSRKKTSGLPQINEIWPPCLRNVFPYYLRSVSGVTVLQSLMDKDLSIACHAKANGAAAIVSNDSDMLIFAVCPVMTARGLVTPRRRVVVMYPNHFCEDVGIPVERLPLLSVYLGNQETPITTTVVEASDGVIQRKIKSGDRGNVQDAIQYVTELEGPISIEELTQDIFQEVDEANIEAVRVSLARYVLRERDYEFDVRPIYKKASPVIEPLDAPCDNMTTEISLFLDKIKTPVIKCDIILKSKAWRREFNIMHMSWPIPGCGIEDPEALYCPIFHAHAYLLGKKRHLMVVPRFESDPIKLAEPAFRNIILETKPLQLPDGTPMPNAHDLWISQDKTLQIMAMVSIWDATDLDFQTLMSMVPATLCFLLVLHWVRRKTAMADWEVLAFLATHVRMRHFTCDSRSFSALERLWRMNDMNISKELTSRSVVLANVFSKLIGRFMWMVSLCGAPFKTVDLLPDLMFDGMIFQKRYEKASNVQQVEKHKLVDAICNQLFGLFGDTRKDRERVNKLFEILNGKKVSIYTSEDDRCRPIQPLSMTNDPKPTWFEEWETCATTTTKFRSSNRSSKPRNSKFGRQKPPPPPAQQQQQRVRSSSGTRHSTRGSRAIRTGSCTGRGQHGLGNSSTSGKSSSSHDRHVSYDRRYDGSGFSSSSGGRNKGYGNTADGRHHEANHYTDDQGYQTAATGTSRALSHGTTAQAKQDKGTFEDNNVLSFSDALQQHEEEADDHCPGRHGESRSLQFQDNDGWGRSDEETGGTERRKQNVDPWEHIWEEAPTPSRRQLSTKKAEQSEKAKVKEWQSHERDSDTWKDVDNEKLNFFSNSEWPNSQADESDIAAEWSSTGAVEQDETRNGNTPGLPMTEISYAQAAGGAKHKKAETREIYHGLEGNSLADKFHSSVSFRNVPEFVPAASRTTSRSPSEATPSEFDGYHSDTFSVVRPVPHRTRAGFAIAGHPMALSHMPYSRNFAVAGRVKQFVALQQPFIQVPFIQPFQGHVGHIKHMGKANNNGGTTEDSNGNDAESIQGAARAGYSMPMNGVMMQPMILMPVPYNALPQMPPTHNM